MKAATNGAPISKLKNETSPKASVDGNSGANQ